MKYKSNISDKVFDCFNYVLCLVISLLCLYPFIYILIVSISDYKQIGLGNVYIFPIMPHFEAYKQLISANSLGRGYYNSILYTGVYTVLCLLLNSMAGYILAEKKFMFKRIITIFLTITMFVSGGLIPNFLWISNLGLYNTIWAIVLPGAISAWNVFIYRTYISGNVHQSLIDSVYMDGGSDLVVYTRIVLPLIKPMLATFGLFAMVGMWNNYFAPLVYLSDADKMPLTIILRKSLIRNSTDGADIANFDITGGIDYEIIQSGQRKAKQMALVVVTITPILLVYPFLQKYFAKGIMIGSIKE